MRIRPSFIIFAKRNCQPRPESTEFMPIRKTWSGSILNCHRMSFGIWILLFILYAYIGRLLFLLVACLNSSFLKKLRLFWTYLDFFGLYWTYPVKDLSFASKKQPKAQTAKHWQKLRLLTLSLIFTLFHFCSLIFTSVHRCSRNQQTPQTLNQKSNLKHKQQNRAENRQ